MHNGKRGQAALEFLMTYGWAILVVLIVIGALAYFGVLNPGNLMPARCTLPTGFSCSQFKVTSGLAGAGGATLRIGNGMGTGIIVSDIILTAGAGNPVASPMPHANTTALFAGWSGTTGVLHMNNGDQIDITVPNTAAINANLATGSKYKWTVSIVYTTDDDITGKFMKTVRGDLLTTVQ